MATAIQFRLTRIHCLVCASLCVVVIMCFLYVVGAGRYAYVTGGTAHPAYPSRNTPLSLPAMAPSADDSQEDKDCDFYSCFDLSRCIHSSSKHVTVHLYDSQPTGVAAAAASRDHREMISAMRSSPYSKEVEGPQKACLFIPPLDLLNLQKLSPSSTREYLQQLPDWNEGQNHLIVHMISSTPGPAWNNVFQKAIVAAANFTSSSYRYGFDVAIPVFNNPSQELASQSTFIPRAKRTWRLIVLGAAELEFPFATVSDAHKTLVLKRCYMKGNYATDSRCGEDHRAHHYPDILQFSQFCLILDHSSTELLDAMMMGCIPVFLQDGYVLPFSEVLDWTRASITIPTVGLYRVHALLDGISARRQEELRQQVHFLHTRYFSSMRAITITILDIINERVLPLSAKGYEAWNNEQFNPFIQDGILAHHPMTAHKADGFTAVVLTHNRLATLFDVIRIISQVPSLQKVVVVWNNMVKSPPPVGSWPKITQPLHVIQPTANKLSNRFYPYEMIETDAVLSIDDDINMLSADEIQFAFEVWCQYPTQLVGFPPRVHRWDKATQKWMYESQWLSNISMVLTGAAFYHKYYNFLFTNGLPAPVKHIIDNNMNCEDIAMNFLISSHTGLPPIKVTPREKFVCVDCPKGGSLGSKTTHYVTRDECVHKFVLEFGWNPLQTVHFRADPVLLRSRESMTKSDALSLV